MLKKKLGIEGIERDHDWGSINVTALKLLYKIPSTLVIPDGCEKIGSWSFEMCPWLKKVTIPESVKIIGTGAFWDCERLKKVIIPESVEVIKRDAFCYCSRATIILKKAESEFKEIGKDAFRECKDVKEEIRN